MSKESNRGTPTTGRGTRQPKAEARLHDALALRAFLTVAELSSFVAAARALHLHTSNVSRHIAGLETALGVQLFVRSSRPVELTREGHRALEPAQQALDALQSLVDVIHSLGM